MSALRCLHGKNKIQIKMNQNACSIHAKKQVKHLERHLSNVHRKTYATYLEETKYPDPVIPSELTFPPKKRVRLSELIGSSSSYTCQNELIVPDKPEWKNKNNAKAKKENVKCSDSESVQNTSGMDVNLAKRDLSRSFDSEEKESKEWLRFLVHNTNSYKVRSLLVYLKQHPK